MRTICIWDSYHLYLYHDWNRQRSKNDMNRVRYKKIRLTKERMETVKCFIYICLSKKWCSKIFSNIVFFLFLLFIFKVRLVLVMGGLVKRTESLSLSKVWVIILEWMNDCDSSPRLCSIYQRQESSNLLKWPVKLIPFKRSLKKILNTSKSLPHTGISTNIYLYQWIYWTNIHLWIYRHIRQRKLLLW